MANRRRFLALLGLGAASGPLAIKAAADAEFARVAGITGLAGGHEGSTVAPSSTPPEAGQDWMESYLAASDQVGKGLPAFAERQLRERSQYVHALDPDLAAKRSWSMAVKILTQRQRNYERRLAELRNWGPDHLAANAFKQLTGYRWPW